MPLVILCGPPKSGKSQFSSRLCSYLLQSVIKEGFELKNVIVVKEEDLGDEKKSRAGLLAGTERALKKDVVVIVDGTNHIKGFRYQLYCLARALTTPHLVVHFPSVDWPCLESPNAQNRWDNPLFLVNAETDELALFEEIAVALQATVVKKPSLATQIPEKITALTPEYLAGLERECHQVLQALYPQLGAAMMRFEGRQIPRQYSLRELQGAQRQFMHLVKAHPVPLDKVRELFVDYLSKHS